MSVSELFEDYRDFALRLANREWARRNRRHLRPEIEQAALIGLWNAAQRWDSRRSVPFRAYAHLRVKGAILDWLRDELGHPARNKQLYRERQQGISLETQDTQGERLKDRIQGRSVAPALDAQDEVDHALRGFSSRTRLCFHLHHGGGYTMREVGSQIGLGASMVGLILKGVERQLRVKQ